MRDYDKELGAWKTIQDQIDSLDALIKELTK